MGYGEYRVDGVRVREGVTPRPRRRQNSGFGSGLISSTNSWLYPLSGETLEPLAGFVRKLPKDSNLAEDGFPGLINQEFQGSFSTDKSICSA